MRECVGVQTDLDHLLSIDESELLQVFPEKFWSSPPLQQPQQAHYKTAEVERVSHTEVRPDTLKLRLQSFAQTVQTGRHTHIPPWSLCWSVDLTLRLSIRMQ